MFIDPSASGRVEDEPSHNYKMAAKIAITIYYPRAAACLYREAKEFKKSSSSRRAHFTRLRAEESKLAMMSLPTPTKWQQRAPS